MPININMLPFSEEQYPEAENQRSRNTHMPELFDIFLFGSTVSRDVSSKRFYRDNFSETRTIDTSTVNSTVPSVIAEWLQEKLRAELQYLFQIDQCTYCGSQYQRRANIGTHNCRYHPFPGYGGTNECCNRPKHTVGCTPCDHKPVRCNATDRWTDSNAHIAIPMFIRDMFDFGEHHITRRYNNPESPAKSYVLVTRVGQQQQLHRGTYMNGPIY